MFRYRESASYSLHPKGFDDININKSTGELKLIEMLGMME